MKAWPGQLASASHGFNGSDVIESNYGSERAVDLWIL
jgi:hypothetical protein